MSKGAVAAIAGSFALCFSLSAQPTDRAAGALNGNSLRFSSLTLADGTYFSFPSAFSRMEMTSPDFLPALSMASVTARAGRATAAAASIQDSSKEVVDMRRSNLFDYVSGEAGFLYGRSIGKYDHEVEAGYIFGETGNDRFHISVGASYENWSGRVPRWGR